MDMGRHREPLERWTACWELDPIKFCHWEIAIRFGAKEAENNKNGHEFEDFRHLLLRPARSWETLRPTSE